MDGDVVGDVVGDVLGVVDCANTAPVAPTTNAAMKTIASNLIIFSVHPLSFVKEYVTNTYHITVKR